jgi:hypothetical protein
MNARRGAGTAETCASRLTKLLAGGRSSALLGLVVFAAACGGNAEDRTARDADGGTLGHATGGASVGGWSGTSTGGGGAAGAAASGGASGKRGSGGSLAVSMDASTDAGRSHSSTADSGLDASTSDGSFDVDGSDGSFDAAREADAGRFVPGTDSGRGLACRPLLRRGDASNASGVCNAGTKDCNASPSDGCEIDVLGDSRNCGGCGRVCPDAIVTSDLTFPGWCVSGVCSLAGNSCALYGPGWASCSYLFADCRYLADDPMNCGGCDCPCAPGKSCVQGMCQ